MSVFCMLRWQRAIEYHERSGGTLGNPPVVAARIYRASNGGHWMPHGEGARTVFHTGAEGTDYQHSHWVQLRGNIYGVSSGQMYVLEDHIARATLI